MILQKLPGRTVAYREFSEKKTVKNLSQELFPIDNFLADKSRIFWEYSSFSGINRLQQVFVTELTGIPLHKK